jgi:hypothetical protein
LKVRASKLQPFRVSHPLLWLLHRGKVIPRLPPDPGTQYPAATVIGSEGVLRVQFPTSRLVLNLDAEYAGTWMIDPHTGERVSIPAVPVAPQPHVASPTPRAENHALRLSEAPSKPRRGWFTRG